MTSTSTAGGNLAAARPPLRRDLRRLFVWIVPANIAIFAIWGSVPTVLLPLQVQAFGEADKALNLAVVTTIGSLAAMLAQPLAGMVSDRTRSRFGRRAPWIVGGALAGGLALVGMAAANGLVQLTIAWMIVQIAYNFAQGPLSAILPDRVPSAVRGTFSALAGLGLLLGSVAGQILGSLLSSSIPAAYLALAGGALVILTLFVVFNPDVSSVGSPREPFSVLAFLRTFWVNPVAHPDFFWAFIGRLLLYAGYFSIAGYQLYLLQDYIGLGDDAAGMVWMFGLASLVGILAATLVCGPLSDRLGRRKVFVFVSSALVGVAFVVPLFAPTVPGWFVVAFLSGLGFGCFQAVDTALMSEVLPSSSSFAKDLGVINIAATLPQALAPAIAGTVFVVTGSFVALFPVAAAFSALGAFAVWPIKAVR